MKKTLARIGQIIFTDWWFVYLNLGALLFNIYMVCVNWNGPSWGLAVNAWAVGVTLSGIAYGVVARLHTEENVVPAYREKLDEVFTEAKADFDKWARAKIGTVIAEAVRSGAHGFAVVIGDDEPPPPSTKVH